jgi:hypothetical protein
MNRSPTTSTSTIPLLNVSTASIVVTNSNNDNDGLTSAICTTGNERYQPKPSSSQRPHIQRRFGAFFPHHPYCQDFLIDPTTPHIPPPLRRKKSIREFLNSPKQPQRIVVGSPTCAKQDLYASLNDWNENVIVTTVVSHNSSPVIDSDHHPSLSMSKIEPMIIRRRGNVLLDHGVTPILAAMKDHPKSISKDAMKEPPFVPRRKMESLIQEKNNKEEDMEGYSSGDTFVTDGLWKEEPDLYSHTDEEEDEYEMINDNNENDEEDEYEIVVDEKDSIVNNL